MKLSSMLAVAVYLAATGCAGPNKIAANAPRVAYSELTPGEAEKHVSTLSHLPFILVFKAGDRVPLNFVLESRLVNVDVPSLTLVAKKDFYVLVRPKGAPLVSEDGKDFSTKTQNSFQVGLSLKKGESPSIQAKIGFRN
jgi:hypothetical protein